MSVSSVNGYRDIGRRIRAKCKGRLAEGERLDAHTTLRIGGPVEWWFDAEDEESLRRAVLMASELGCPVHVFGGGSNLLLPDEGLKGLAVHMAGPEFRGLCVENGEVTSGGGVPLALFLQFLIQNNKGDCEFLMGIPAQVGGAVMMNAGSATKWIGSYLVKARVVDFEGRVRDLPREEIHFEYRASGLKDVVITHATFRFPDVPASVTQERLGAYSDYRRRTQDLKYPNAGCMFQNPDGGDPSAGRLIEQAGLKGRKIGHAQVSNIHANFVVNLGGARQKDVLDILELVEETVFSKFRIRLRREIKIIRVGAA